MQEFLESGETTRPRVVKQQTTSGDLDAVDAVVTSNLRHGELFLKNDRETIRLRWPEGTKPGEAARTVPGDSYKILGYRVVEGDWMISTTGGRNQVQLEAGETTKLEVGTVIQMKARIKRKRGEIRLGMGIMSPEHMGLSIYKNGKRIPMRYRLLDANGKKLNSGRMNYG